MNIELSEKYAPLFALLGGDYPDVDTVVITGGRFSQKSFAVGTWACVAAKDYGHRALYTRYTLTTVEDSIIPEFKEKIELLQAEKYFDVMKDRVRGVYNKSKIVFKGIKTSQGNQTASLKSLKDFSMFIVEEAEELPNFEDWDKVRKSIRANDVRNLNVLLLNSTTKTHWIYGEFFEDRGVVDGFNGVKGNVMYIHTTYMDIPRKYIPDAIFNDFERKRLAYEEWIKLDKDERETSKLKRHANYYLHTVLGGWLSKSEGVIFTNWSVGDFVDTGYTKYGCDFGFSDPTTLVKVSVNRELKRIYLKEEYYKSGSTEAELFDVMRGVCGGMQIVADSALPMIIEGLRRQGLNIIGCVKGSGSLLAGLNIMLDYDLIVDGGSGNLIKELNHYEWNDKRSKVPVDKWNHCFNGDTLISVDGGVKFMRDIVEGDLVLTRFGYRRVLKKFNNGKRLIKKYWMLFDTFLVYLECTDSHLIYTEKGWKKIIELQSEDVVILNKGLMESFSSCILEKDIFLKEEKGCIDLFGSSTMEKSKNNLMCTIKTKIHGTIGLKTSNSGRGKNICRITEKKGVIFGSKSFRKKVVKKLLNGINLSKVERGIEIMPRLLDLENLVSEKKIAWSVVKNLPSKIQLENFAQTHAGLPVEENQELITSNKSVNFVKRNLLKTNIQKSKLVHVVAVKEWEEDVFDFMVEDYHEYFANGVLVHNCIDAARYAVSDLVDPPKDVWVGW